MNSETIDPLLYLRDYLTNNKPISIVDKQLDFDNGLYKIPLDTQTAWKRSDKDVYYTLGSLYLAFMFCKANLSEYNKEARNL